MIMYRKNITACIGAAFSIFALFMIFMNSKNAPNVKIKEYTFPEYNIVGKAPNVQYYEFPETVITVKL